MDRNELKPIPIKIDKNFASNFDELINIDVSNRKSNVWFSDKDKLMIKMRPWTSQLWNTLTWWTWISGQYFFTDFFLKRHHIIWYNNRVYRYDSWTWTDLWVNFWWNDFFFNRVRLPMNLDWSIPITYTNSANWWWAEQIAIASWDTTPNPIWKTLIITDDPWNNQAYRGVFWIILDNSWGNYTLQWAWIVTAVKSGASYQIYTNTWEYLQIMNWVSNDRYFYWKNDWILYENITFSWFATNSLRNIRAIESTQYISKQFFYKNYFIAFNKWTIYYSVLWNPFFYNFTWAITIPWVSWDINDVFEFKNRLIIWWTNYIAYINWITNLIQVEFVVKWYWMKANSLVDLWTDAYFLSSDRQIFSLSETLQSTLISTNVWEQVEYYLQNFNTNISTWFDWKKMYMYWQKDNTSEWIILVLDIQYKFWSIYTWLRPSSIVTENAITYLTSNILGKVSFFDNTIFTDLWEEIEQKIVTKEIDLGDVFSLKELSSIYLWLENFNQELTIDTYYSLVLNNTKKPTKTISTEEIYINWSNNSMGAWVLWENIIWGVWYEKNISLPFMKKIDYDSDNGLLWKIILTWKNWSPFYLNQLDLMIWFSMDTKEYFSPWNTI